MNKFIEFMKSFIGSIFTFFIVIIVLVLFFAMPAIFIFVSLANFQQTLFQVPGTILFTCGGFNVLAFCIIMLYGILFISFLSFITSDNKWEFLKSLISTKKSEFTGTVIILLIPAILSLLFFANYQYASEKGIHNNVTFGVRHDYSWNEVSKVGFTTNRGRSGEYYLYYKIYFKDNTSTRLGSISNKDSVKEALQFLYYIKNNNILLEKPSFDKNKLESMEDIEGAEEFLSQIF